MERVKVTIEKETAKAYLLNDFDGNKGWIQQRWLVADSTVNNTTWQKAISNYSERQSAWREAKQWSQDYHVINKIDRETEKAVAVKVAFDAYNLERTFRRLIWFPKSMVKDMAVQGWLIAAKVREAGEQLSEEINTGVMFLTIGIEDCQTIML